MIPFAETEQLYIRGIEERDIDKVLFNTSPYPSSPTEAD
jgi:hypothetical protein